jgi:putative transposase
MPQSLSRNYIHIVFSTKNREPMLYSPVREELFAFIGGICKRMECFPIRVGGYTDHVHILCLLSKKLALMKLVEEVKSHSSKWIKPKGEYFHGFYWQEGYGAFSVSPVQVDPLIAYIENQELHHQKKNFQEEYRAILHKYEVEINEKYVWD